MALTLGTFRPSERGERERGREGERERGRERERERVREREREHPVYYVHRCHLSHDQMLQQ